MSELSQTLLRLRQIQGWDDEIRALSATRTRLPRELRGAEMAMQEATAAHEAHRALIMQLKAQIDALELQIKACEAKVANLSGKQNAAASNKEYSALQTDIDNTRAEMAKLEDQELVLMDKLDAATTALPDFESRFANRVAERDRQQAAIAGKIEAIDREIVEIERQKSDIAAHVPPDIFAKYNEIRGWRDGVGIVGVTRQGFCQGCQTKITPDHMSRVLGEKELIICPSCNRILYLADPIAK